MMGKIRISGVRAVIFVALWGSGVAEGAGFTAVLGGLGQDYAAAVALDAAGNTYVAGLTYSKDFPVTAGAVQTTFGGTCDAFVAKLGPDGKVTWATFLGGKLDDGATGIALDPAGNVIVGGFTRSTDFPTAHAAQAVLNGGAPTTNYDAFVAKLDPSGKRLLYSTFLGGPDADVGVGLAVDAAGNAYLARNVTFSSQPGISVDKLDPQGTPGYSYFRPGGAAAAVAVDAAGSAYVTGLVPPLAAGIYGAGNGLAQVLVFKLSADGRQAVYEKTIGGGGGANGTTIAVGRDGSAYIGGVTASTDFPLVRPLQSELGALPLWQSVDGGANWTPVKGLPFALPQVMAVAADALYVATADAGMAKSTDGGATWRRINNGIADSRLTALTVDPGHPQTVYAGSASGTVYQTTDGGANWRLAVQRPKAGVQEIALDGVNVYAVWTDNVVDRSSDGGATWSAVSFNGGVASFAADPATPGNVWAYSQFIYGGAFGTPIPPYLWHSVDAGATWTRLTSPAPVLQGPILFDPSTKPSTIYIGPNYRSDDGGITWVALPRSAVTAGTQTAMTVGPDGTLYIPVSNDGIYVSRDRGETWTRVSAPVFQAAAVIPVSGGSTVFALAVNRQTAGFVTKLSPDGNNIVFSTFLGGTVSFGPQTIFVAEPGGMTWQNGISALALDREGNVIVAGATRAHDFPLAGSPPCTNAGGADAFVATIAADGSRLASVECLGGTQDDGVLAIAANHRGGVVAAGQTWSWDIPLSPNLPPFVGFGDAFVRHLGEAALPAAPIHRRK